MKPVKIMDTTLRDGHQSLMATRMRLEEMLPILDEIDQVGYEAIEMWGGATYDACIRFLDEDPWERLRAIRKGMKKTKLQMLLRAQNLLGYRHYADDIVTRFVKKSVEHGMDIIRIFDALNDVRNLRQATKACKEAGAHAQLAICYTISPVHTDDYYLDLAKEMEALGADSIAIKDMSGILLPDRADRLVTLLKSAIDLPVQMHCHCTAGLAPTSYFRGVLAGADLIDTAISPFANGTSQPPIESMMRILEGTGRCPDFDMERLQRIAEYFKPIRDKYIADGTMNPKALYTEPTIVDVQLPGGMLSNLVSQLKAQGAEGRYEEVLKEIPRVREDLGYPPLVTPLSQMVGTQAVMNVLTGERYKLIPNEIKDYVRGKYGRSPVPIAEAMVAKLIGDDQRISCRPADLLKDEYERLKVELGDLGREEEDVLTYALFPQVAETFLKKKYQLDPPDPVEYRKLDIVF